MSRASAASIKLARELLAAEAARASLPATGVKAGESALAAHVCDRLREALSPFVGSGGFRALLRRALALAVSQAPPLADVEVLEDGSLSGCTRIPGGGAGCEILVAWLLDLLITFIGEVLMLGVVSNTWPELPENVLRPRTEDKS